MLQATLNFSVSSPTGKRPPIFALVKDAFDQRKYCLPLIEAKHPRIVQATQASGGAA